MLVTELLSRLEQHGRRWQVRVPAELGTFFGHGLSLEISTCWPTAPGPTPSVDPSELSLAKLVLTELPSVLAQAQAQFRNYREDGEDVPERHVRDPVIWIDRDIRAEDGASRWSLVVHHDEWPDYGWHIEFDGTQCIDIWAGS